MENKISNKLEEAMKFLDQQFGKVVKSESVQKKKKKKTKKREEKLDTKQEEVNEEIKAEVKPQEDDRMEIDEILKEVEQEVEGSINTYSQLNVKRPQNAPSAADKIKGIMDPKVQHLYDQNFKNSMFLIDNSKASSNMQGIAVLRKKKSSFRGILKPSKSHIKRSKIFDIQEGEIIFKDMIPIHSIWKEYIKDLIYPPSQQSKLNEYFNKNKMNVLLKLAKCDLHGAVVSIFESKVKSHIGIEGIIVKESRQTFTIIKTNNKLVTVPKANSTFLIKIPEGPKVKIYGDSLCQRSSDRSSMKYKPTY